MAPPPSDLFFEVTRHANGAFSIKGLNTTIQTAAHDAQQLYDNISAAVTSHFPGQLVPGPESIHLLLYEE